MVCEWCCRWKQDIYSQRWRRSVYNKVWIRFVMRCELNSKSSNDSQRIIRIISPTTPNLKEVVLRAHHFVLLSLLQQKLGSCYFSNTWNRNRPITSHYVKEFQQDFMVQHGLNCSVWGQQELCSGFIITAFTIRKHLVQPEITAGVKYWII